MTNEEEDIFEDDYVDEDEKLKPNPFATPSFPCPYCNFEVIKGIRVCPNCHASICTGCHH